ncbi:MAG: ABC transporter permease [Puniceicoccales bacterium]|jgi:ABC-2 type transport system permease protein|nr:ABC transporter permease [Puniceicoccales bacterium]
MKIIVALIRKEFLQIMRDPSSLIVAFILPTILLLIYTYGINLDAATVKIGIKNDDSNAEISSLMASFSQNKYTSVTTYFDREEMCNDIAGGKIRGAVTIPGDFSKKLAASREASISLITDCTDISQARYAQSYVSEIVNGWLVGRCGSAAPQRVILSPRFWYNQNLDGRWALVPSSLAVTMTLIGILLSALVISREWEHGTMEALLSTRVKPIHIVIGKYVPYFTVGMCSLAFSICVMVTFLGIPFRGSYPTLLLVSSLFLFACLGIGLLMSSVLKNQLLASMASIVVGFLPSLMLSGMIFPIGSMPKVFQWLTLILPPRYYVNFVKSEFLSGTIAHNVAVNGTFLLLLGLFFSMLVYRKTARRIDVRG